MKQRIIALWAHPRSVSTAFERIMIERGDLHILHEPFSHLYYLHEKRGTAEAHDSAKHKGVDYQSIRRNILENPSKQNIFIKDMAYHCFDHICEDEAFLKNLSHSFLIRHPKAAIESHYAKNPKVTQEEIGYDSLFHLLKRVHEVQGIVPPIIEAEKLQQNPQAVIKKYCTTFNLEFKPQALQWQKGQQQAWQSWQGWHQQVAASTGIESRKRVYEDTVENHPRLQELYEASLPFYERIRAFGSPGN